MLLLSHKLIILKSSYLVKEHGCCPDGLTRARGANYKGCEKATPCKDSLWGCCDDLIHPAHGPNKEGCCLTSTFGCCQDNVNPAKGKFINHVDTKFIHFWQCLCKCLTIFQNYPCFTIFKRFWLYDLLQIKFDQFLSFLRQFLPFLFFGPWLSTWFMNALQRSQFWRL